MPVSVKAQIFVVSGKFVKTASLRIGKEEWLENIQNPKEIIPALKAAPIKIDLFRFWQRIPETETKFSCVNSNINGTAD